MNDRKIGLESEDKEQVEDEEVDQNNVVDEYIDEDK